MREANASRANSISNGKSEVNAFSNDVDVLQPRLAFAKFALRMQLSPNENEQSERVLREKGVFQARLRSMHAGEQRCRRLGLPPWTSLASARLLCMCVRGQLFFSRISTECPRGTAIFVFLLINALCAIHARTRDAVSYLSLVRISGHLEAAWKTIITWHYFHAHCAPSGAFERVVIRRNVATHRFRRHEI